MIRVGQRFYELNLGPAPLPGPCTSCGRSAGTAKRTWMAPTLFGAPLVVVGVETHFKCAWCGTEVLGREPPGAPPIPIRQRLGVVFLLAFFGSVYGVWFVANAAMDFVGHRRSDRARAAASASAAAQPPDPALARAAAERDAKEASANNAACMSRLLALDPGRIADQPFWARTKIETAPSAALAATPYFGFDSLEAERTNASTVGGFACSSGDATDPKVVVVSRGGCKTDKKWCRVGFLWVDLASKRVVAAATEDAPWTSEDGNEPATKAANERLRARVASWKSAPAKL